MSPRWSKCPRPHIGGPQTGQLWKHYKGDTYLVLNVTNDSENRGQSGPLQRVVYQLADGTGRVWDRPASMWQEEVELHSYHSSELDQGVQKPTTRRFMLDAAATPERRIEAVKRFIAHDLEQVLNEQFIGSGAKTDWDSLARGLTGHPDAKGSAVPDEDTPTLMHVTLTIPLPVQSIN